MSVYAHRGIIIRLLFLTLAVLCALVTGFGRLRRRRVITLCYHGVTGAQQNSFSRQMARVAAHAVDPGDIAHPPAGRFAAPMVCITFDDAFANLLDHALPTTLALTIPVIVFAPTGCLGSPPSWRIARDHPDAAEHTMTADQITQARTDRLCRFGSHGATHRPLTELSPDQARRELAESKAVLATLIGGPVEDLAFPHGAYNEQLVEAARAAGYRRIFTLDPDPSVTCQGIQIVARMKMSPNAWPIEFILTISGAYDWLPPARRMLKAIAGWAGVFTNRHRQDRRIRGGPRTRPITRPSNAPAGRMANDASRLRTSQDTSAHAPPVRFGSPWT